MNRKHMRKKLFFTLFTCLLFTGCSAQTKKDSSEQAIRAVLQQQFTAPDAEYIRLAEEVEKQLLENRKETADPQGVVSLPEGAPELQEMEAYVKETFDPYFTENGYENMRPLLFFYHWSTMDYELEVTDLSINQSDVAPTHYDFIAQVLYTNRQGQTLPFEITGTAICPEEGKIGKMTVDDHGLMQQMQQDFPQS
ncbi:hypothetical protein [Sporosarcina sp. HYO08]|uniref:hypothetical protein n=1 Tax=Sporosarcina sp. HYO08 TaxID=1759557 RepID=UPI000796C86A|nr:hypothetical protein [Sporosarcina sp. HYO08]KXH81682.1 hypothetical protein AU377_05270 [Sporosarcina sp. HYO08]